MTRAELVEKMVYARFGNGVSQLETYELEAVSIVTEQQLQVVLDAIEEGEVVKAECDCEDSFPIVFLKPEFRRAWK